ncbi:Putative phage tail protein D [Sulfurovum sp. enrichment culture clone C5]|uniref:Putative phage tail protein D n=1 Tax=Sulfurovum sp. enrichment culture clone C5 TaxID=497650 RepID=A0A0S4XLQ7_9BACT|nr:Putative phage tail protein D [Sulfurovum sp. enrichment culture clone C5]
MELTPAFLLTANGKDITDSLNTDTASFRLTDNDGDVADELTIVVTGDFKRPKAGDVLDFSLGYKETGVSFVGRYFVQTTEREDLSILTITATSVNWGEALKEQRDAKYEKTTVAKIAKIVADRHKLKVKTDCDDLTTTYIAQQNESDLDFLSRISDRYDLVFNIKNETVVMLHRSKDKNSSLPRFNVSAINCGEIRIKHSNRTYYVAAKAIYRDIKSNKNKEVLVGEKDKKPVLKITDDFKSDTEAKQVATAGLAKANRSLKNGSLTQYGSLIFAGGVLNLTDAGEDDGEYIIKSVSHSLDDNGWSMDIEVEA